MVQHPSYVRSVEDYEISAMASRLGYVNYLPYQVVRDMMAIRGNQIMNDGKIVDLWPTPYSTALIELFSMFDQTIIKSNSILEFAVNVLKLMSRKVNLRELEKSLSTKQPVLIDLESKQVNYADDLSEVNPEYFDILGIETTGIPINELVLHPDVYEVIHFYNGLKQISGSLFPTTIVTRNKMTKVSDVHKVRRYRFALPSFLADIALKKPSIKTEEVEMKQNNSVIVMVDVSWSTTLSSTYNSMVKAVFLSLLDSFIDNETTIDVLEFFNSPSREFTISTKEELINYVNYKPTPQLGASGWSSMGKFMKKYDGKTVILITDGELVTGPISGDPKLFIVSNRFNRKLADLSFNTDGKFVVV